MLSLRMQKTRGVYEVQLGEWPSPTTSPKWYSPRLQRRKGLVYWACFTHFTRNTVQHTDANCAQPGCTNTTRVVLWDCFKIKLFFVCFCCVFLPCAPCGCSSMWSGPNAVRIPAPPLAHPLSSVNYSNTTISSLSAIIQETQNTMYILNKWMPCHHIGTTS